MYTNGAIVVLAVAFSSTLQLSSARYLPRRDMPVTANGTDAQDDTQNLNSTSDCNQTSYDDASKSRLYMNGE